MRPSFTFWLLLFGFLAVGYYLVVPKIAEPNEKARPMAAQADIKDGIKSALDAYQIDNGSYPKSLQDLVQQSADAKNWRGPYLGSLPIDPWGNKYIYEFPGKHNTNDYDLFSAGSDGKAGTKDDIVNWTK